MEEKERERRRRKSEGNKSSMNTIYTQERYIAKQSYKLPFWLLLLCPLVQGSTYQLAIRKDGDQNHNTIVHVHVVSYMLYNYLINIHVHVRIHY